MDGRRNNGGNSTKSKGVDRRKNPFRKAIEEACSVEKVKEVLESLYDEARNEKNTQAAKIYLEYALGKPTQSIEWEDVTDRMTPEEAKAELERIRKAKRS